MKPQAPVFKIYVDGQLDVRATYLPVVKQRVLSALNIANDKFVELSRAGR